MNRYGKASANPDVNLSACQQKWQSLECQTVKDNVNVCVACCWQCKSECPVRVVNALPFQFGPISWRLRISWLREYARIPQGANPPTGGSPAFFKQQSTNSNFEWSPWKDFFLICWQSVQNQKSCIFSYFPCCGSWILTSCWPLGHNMIVCPLPSCSKRGSSRAGSHPPLHQPRTRDSR